MLHFTRAVDSAAITQLLQLKMEVCGSSKLFPLSSTTEDDQVIICDKARHFPIQVHSLIYTWSIYTIRTHLHLLVTGSCPPSNFLL